MKVKCLKCRENKGYKSFLIHQRTRSDVCKQCTGLLERRKCVQCLMNWETPDKMGLCEPCTIKRYSNVFHVSIPLEKI